MTGFLEARRSASPRLAFMSSNMMIAPHACWMVQTGNVAYEVHCLISRWQSECIPLWWGRRCLWACCMMSTLVLETTQPANLHRLVHSDQTSAGAASRETISPRPMTGHAFLKVSQSDINCMKPYNQPIMELRSFLTKLWSSHSSLPFSIVTSPLLDIKSMTSCVMLSCSFPLPLSDLSVLNASVRHARDDRLLTAPTKRETVTRSRAWASYLLYMSFEMANDCIIVGMAALHEKLCLTRQMSVKCRSYMYILTSSVLGVVYICPREVSWFTILPTITNAPLIPCTFNRAEN